ncbi:T-cell surface antigen CD2 isoform X2 [Pelodiscus sinensis]|uniref:T-cell surface antigen CD2 isoform X2 n=1 Tax=Pelodiscus sinensis TaxID=13735 RepID=UPI003F6CBA09
MSIRGILLAKCLVVLFFCVTGSSDEVYKVLDDFAFLTISDFSIQKTDEIRWYKDNSVIMKLKNNDITNYMKKEAYNMSQNGTLQIHRLVKEDSGNYKVQVYNVEGKLKMEKNFHLIIQDHVSKPKITWTCSKKTVKVICEVNQTDKASIHLLQNNKAVPGNKPASANGKLKIEFTYRNTTFPAKFQCEVKNDADKKTVEQEIRCSARVTGHCSHTEHCWRCSVLCHFSGTADLLYQEEESRKIRRRGRGEIDAKSKNE